MATAVETIKTFMNALNAYRMDNGQIGRIALDDAVRQSTTYNDLAEVVSSLKKALANTETYPDTDTRLQKATGMVLGAKDDLSVDTGAVTGYNAGGSTVKNAASIVPETGDMSTAELPAPGSTTPVTYTGEDGKTFTFYVKWPNSFTTIVDCTNAANVDEAEKLLDDSRYELDLTTRDANAFYYQEKTNANGSVTRTPSPTYGQMLNAIPTILKGLNTWWLREGAKLDYDSLGVGLDGQTIEIKFVAGEGTDWASAITYARRNDWEPSNFISLAINLFNNGRVNENDPNGLVYDSKGNTQIYLDRVIAHELVHAIMQANGMWKAELPEFFTEGIAELVHGLDDYNGGETARLNTLVNDPDTLAQALNYAPGTGGEYAYPAGDMLLRHMAQQSLNTTAIIGDPTQAQTFDYNGNEEVITNYTESDTINFNVTLTGAYMPTPPNDLIIKSNGDDVLVLRDVRGKVVTLNMAGSNAYAYMTEGAGEVNGNNFGGGNGYEILFGANYENNTIRAGNAGSYLWGGNRGDDELFGGAGADTFVYYYDGGHDTIHNAESQDSVYLEGFASDTFLLVSFTDDGVAGVFSDGGSLNIEGQPSTFTVKYDGKENTYRADYQNKSWSQV